MAETTTPTEEIIDSPVEEIIDPVIETANPLDSYAEENIESIEIQEEVGPDIDETAGEDYDPATQNLLEYKMVTTVDGKSVVQTVRKIIDKSEEEIQIEQAVSEEKTISDKVKELKFKVATGKATTTEKADLKLLIG